MRISPARAHVIDNRTLRLLNEINVDLKSLHSLYSSEFLTIISNGLIDIDNSAKSSTALLQSFSSKFHQLIETDDSIRDIIVKFLDDSTEIESDELYYNFWLYQNEYFPGTKNLNQLDFFKYLNVCRIIHILTH